MIKKIIGIYVNKYLLNSFFYNTHINNKNIKALTMFNKKLIAFLSIIFIITITIGTISATDQIDNISLRDSNSTQISENQSFNDIQNKINEASAKDTITLNGTYQGNGKAISIKKELTIEGNSDTIIDAQGSSRIITASKDVTFKNLTFKNGKDESAGAVYATSNLTFINCIFIGNTADSYGSGAAIYSKGNIDMINCTFKKNYSPEDSIVMAMGDYVTIKDSLFEENSGQNVINAWANSNIQKSTFMNNKANVLSAIFYAEVSDCIFTDNKGGIICEYGIYARNCSFTGNDRGIYQTSAYGKKTKIVNCNFRNQKYGALELNGETDITNSTFINNKAKTYGGAIFSTSWSDEPYYGPPTEKINIKDCLFASNSAVYGGAIYNEHNTLTISNCIFENNTADFGGVLDSCGSQTTITGSTLKNNSYGSIVLNSIDDSYASYHATGKLKINGKTFTKSVILDDSLKNIVLVKATAKKVKTIYYSGNKLKVILTNKFNGKPLKNSKISIKVYTGKKSKFYTRYTNSKGILTFAASTLSAGTHKVELYSNYGLCKLPKITTSITVKKAKAAVKAPKVVNKHKKSKYFKVTLKHKTTKKPVKYTWIKLKIGKKTYKVKTNSKGIAKFNTKNLKIGKHNVKITSGNSNYIIKAKSTIKIKR